MRGYMDQDIQGRRNDKCKGLNPKEACRDTLRAERKPREMENRELEAEY